MRNCPDLRKSYIDYERDEFKKSNDFTDTVYYKIVSFSLKLYTQGFETHRDILGNVLTAEEIQLCETLINKMKKELDVYKEKFDKEVMEQD
ncbi:hypothetical protein ACYSTM_21080 [Bacillus licheniformis]